MTTQKQGIEKRGIGLAFSFKKKITDIYKIFALAALFLIITNIHIAYSIDPSGWAGSVLDPIIDGGAEYSAGIASEVTDTLIQLLSLSFSPNFFTLMNTEYPSMIYGTVTKQMVKESYFFSSVFGLAQMLGIIIATILFFVNAFMLIIGNGDKIRDNPLTLIIRYIASMVAVYVSFDIVYSVIMCIDEIWSQFVFRGYTSIYAGQSFYQTETSRIFSQNPETGKVIVWGAQLNVGMDGIWKAVISCLGILLIWKLIKAIFRLYMEVAERYFVLMVLCAFFPVAVATYTCNTTKNIFFSYLRMFFSQAFVMLANIAFMKSFMFVLFRGGWLASLPNYISAQAFVRVAQRLDSYMFAMGLNVAQTGSGLINSINGAGMGFVNMFRGANNTRKNLGKSLIGVGIASNDAGLFKAGAIAGFSGETMVRGMVPSETSFENSIARYSGVNSPGFSAMKGMDNASGPGTSAEDTNWLRNTLKENGIPTTDIDKLQSLGIDPNSIVRVEKDSRTGAIGYSDKKGAIATSYKGEMYNNQMRDQEMEFNAKQANISQNFDPNIGADQSMSEADAARVVEGMNDFNTNVSHVDLDTLRSLYAGDYDSLETVAGTRGEQEEMFRSGDNVVDAKPYGMDSVGHSRMQFRGRYTDQLQPKSDDFYVDMYNVAQHPETLKNQGLTGWHFVKQGNEGFMVHDNRHTADDRSSVVGKISPMYQKSKPNLNAPENHIDAKKPTANNDSVTKTNKDPNAPTPAPMAEPAPVSTPAPMVGAAPISTPAYEEKASTPPPVFSEYASGPMEPEPIIIHGNMGGPSVDEVYNYIYGDGSSPSSDPSFTGQETYSTMTVREKDRTKGSERHESTIKDKAKYEKRNEEKPRSSKPRDSKRRKPNHKNIPIDFEDD